MKFAGLPSGGGATVLMHKSKQEIRNLARAERERLSQRQPDFARALGDHAGALAIPDGSLIGAYAALPREADPHILLKKLSMTGCTFAFPRVAAKGAALVFHHWQPGREMQPGAYGILEPSSNWAIAYPKILLVPLLAFDAHGHRLGYGGGFYDRTIETLKPERTIGVAFSGQEVETLPRDQHDIALDCVITENGVRNFRSRPE